LADLDQLKQKSIVDYLKSIGAKHKGRLDKRLVYFYSPLHPDSDPSFVVYTKNNSWYDWGMGVGGSIIDLVQQTEKLSFVEALRYLEGDNTPRYTPTPQVEEKDAIEVLEEHEIRNRDCIDSITSRKLDLSLVRMYVKEAVIRFNNSNTIIPVLSFQNDKGGRELRTKFKKYSTTPKYYTTIQGEQNAFNVFEGWTDFIACLQYYKTNALKNETIVLNSVSFCVSLHQKNLFKDKRVNLFLDNDEAGDKATSFLSEHFNTIDHRNIYEGYEDFNDFIKGKPKQLPVWRFLLGRGR
jgi:DNA primase